jgi:hypothetical protein
LWDLAQSGDCRWAVHLLLNRWLGRLPMHVDLQQQVTLDLTASLDPSTLARYRWLVQHEDSLTLTKSKNCSNSACGAASPCSHLETVMTSDKNLWSTSDLQRYYTLLKKQIDAAVLPELTLTDDEQREVERYRLGLVERIDVPLRDGTDPQSQRPAPGPRYAPNVAAAAVRTSPAGRRR